jgi:hypothetical protein
MKYAVFSVFYLVFISAVFTVLNPSFGDTFGSDFARDEGIAAGGAVLVAACLGLLYKTDRFRGFMIAAVFFSGIHIANMLGWIEKIAQR